MIYPLSWLSQYVALPKDDKELTDRLTMMGHMLDKKIVKDKETIIDLELRGNRPDLLGILGLAREISAYWKTPLKLPSTKKLPPVDKNSDLVTIKAPELVERYLAVPLSVKIKPSPPWLQKILGYYGIAPINNVVDITNYVMFETGEPMHAFDTDKLTGKKLILRNAHNHEAFTTFQGTTVKLSPEDLVISDLKTPQALTIIGSRNSGVSSTTNSIILEAAVYKYANVRHTARRVNIHTEAGIRHEKILDPNLVQLALERAYYLLEELADAKPLGKSCDYYPNLNQPKEISFDYNEVSRLTGTIVPQDEAKDILKRLDFQISPSKDKWLVTSPTFRTDVDQSADLVEEIIRVYGYEKIPEKQLSGEIPNDLTSASLNLEEKVRDSLTNLGFNEIITSPLIADADYKLFSASNEFLPPVTIINPPDIQLSTLRPTLLINLVHSSVKAINFRQNQANYFEIGKVFGEKGPGKYIETKKVGLVLSSNSPENLQAAIAQINGVIKGLLEDLGVDYDIVDKGRLAKIIHPAGNTLGTISLFDLPIVGVELDLDEIIKVYNLASKKYQTYPSFPPIVEDLSFPVQADTKLGKVVSAIKKISKLITKVELIDIFEANRTLRITYMDPQKSLSSKETSPIRDQILTTLDRLIPNSH